MPRPCSSHCAGLCGYPEAGPPPDAWLADDATGRRLDGLALAVMEQLGPAYGTEPEQYFHCLSVWSIGLPRIPGPSRMEDAGLPHGADHGHRLARGDHSARAPGGSICGLACAPASSAVHRDLNPEASVGPCSSGENDAYSSRIVCSEVRCPIRPQRLGRAISERRCAFVEPRIATLPQTPPHTPRRAPRDPPAWPANSPITRGPAPAVSAGRTERPRAAAPRPM